MPSNSNDQRIIGLITLLVVSLIPFISLEFEAKVLNRILRYFQYCWPKSNNYHLFCLRLNGFCF